MIITLDYFQGAAFSVFFYLVSLNVANFTFVGTWQGELRALLLVLSFNKLILSYLMTKLAINLTTWALSLKMTGQILSL